MAELGTSSTEKNAHVLGPPSPDPTSPDKGPNVKDRGKDLFDRTDRLESKFNTASENGLFAHQDEVKHPEILALLKQAFTLSLQPKITPEQYGSCIEMLDTAQYKLDTAIQKVGLKRRLVYVYGAPAAAYLLGVLAVVLWISLWPPSIFTGSPSFLSVPLQVFYAGTIGGILRGVRGLWSQVDNLQYRKFWGTWFLLCPVMGALLGGIVSLAFVAGVVVTTLSTAIANPTLAVLVAMIAGYNWKWANDILSKIPKLFSTGPTKQKTTSSPSASPSTSP